MEVQAPPGTIIGYVVQEWNPCIPILSIQNEMSETILKIRGPCMQFSCCGDVNFKVSTYTEGTPHWSPAVILTNLHCSTLISMSLCKLIETSKNLDIVSQYACHRTIFYLLPLHYYVYSILYVHTQFSVVFDTICHGIGQNLSFRGFFSPLYHRWIMASELLS